MTFRQDWLPFLRPAFPTVTENGRALTMRFLSASALTALQILTPSLSQFPNLKIVEKLLRSDLASSQRDFREVLHGFHS